MSGQEKGKVMCCKRCRQLDLNGKQMGCRVESNWIAGKSAVGGESKDRFVSKIRTMPQLEDGGWGKSAKDKTKDY